MYALEWQAYLHAPDKEKGMFALDVIVHPSHPNQVTKLVAPSCPRPDFCNEALSLDQIVRRGLIRVLNHEQFPHVPYNPHGDDDSFRRRRKGDAQSQPLRQTLVLRLPA